MSTQYPSEKLIANRTSEGVASDLPSQLNVADFQFKIFSTLWAIASLFHMAHSSTFDSQLNLALLTLSALYVILRPALIPFVLLIILQLFDAFFRMPFTTNHWIFTAFVNLTILQSIVFLIWKNRSFNLSGGEVFKFFAPVVRIEVVILYFFAVFHKLNSGFFSPATSCATDLLKAQNIDNFVPLTDTVYAFNAYFTLIVESMIPVLLCFRKTRNAAVLLGLFFHCVLSYSSYNAFYDFSSMVFAAYFLFINQGFSASLYEIPIRLKSSAREYLKSFQLFKLTFIGFFLFVFLIVIYLLNKKMDTFHSVHLYFFWTVYSILFTWCFVRYMFSARNSQVMMQPTFSLPHRSLLIIPIIVLLNGTIPYFGLKTENSYAMFSNLRTEGGKTNHYIIPASLQLFDYQKEYVEILSSTDAGLQLLASENKAMVLFEFKNYVNDRKPERVEYLHNGKKHIFLGSEKASLDALGKNSYFLAKLMKFRPFKIDEPQPCAH